MKIKLILASVGVFISIFFIFGAAKAITPTPVSNIVTPTPGTKSVTPATCPSGWWWDAQKGKCCHQNPSGGFEPICANPSASPSSGPTSSPSHTPTPTATSNKITLSGSISLSSACVSDDPKDLAGAKVTVYDNSNSNQLGQVTATLDTSGKPKYTVTVNKVSSNSYKIKATKDNYHDKVNTLTATANTTVNLTMQPKNVYIQGKVYDDKTKKGIPNIYVYLSDHPELGASITSKSGSYLFYAETTSGQTTTEFNVRPKNSYQYVERVSVPNIPTTCRRNKANISMTKKKSCSQPGGLGIEFCWWGDTAISYKNNPSFDAQWIEMAYVFRNLRAKTASQNIPRRVNILSTVQTALWADQRNKEIYFSYHFLNQSTNNWFSYNLLKTSLIPHEFAHTYNFLHKDIDSPFEYLLKDGEILRLSNPAYTNITVYKILSPDWIYYIGDYGYTTDYAGGYSATGNRELFAETFATMYSFDSKMHAKIADSSYPLDLRNYAKRVHNGAANYFPHGNTIAIQDFVNQLVASATK